MDSSRFYFESELHICTIRYVLVTECLFFCNLHLLYIFQVVSPSLDKTCCHALNSCLCLHCLFYNKSEPVLSSSPLQVVRLTLAVADTDLSVARWSHALSRVSGSGSSVLPSARPLRVTTLFRSFSKCRWMSSDTTRGQSSWSRP